MSTGFTEPLVGSKKSQGKYFGYRGGRGITPSQEWSVVFDDFHASLSTTDTPRGWNIFTGDTGATLTKDTANGQGVLKISSDGTTEGHTAYLDKFVDGSRAWYVEARVKVDDGDDCDMMIGVSVLTATTNPEDAWDTTSDDMAAYGVVDGGAGVLQLNYDESDSGINSETSADTTNHVLDDDTWTILAIEYDGRDLHGWKNGVRTITASDRTAIPDDVIMAPFFGFRTGDTATDDGYIDYFRVVSARS